MWHSSCVCLDSVRSGQCGKPVRVRGLCVCRGYSHWLGSEPVCAVGGLGLRGVEASACFKHEHVRQADEHSSSSSNLFVVVFIPHTNNSVTFWVDNPTRASPWVLLTRDLTQVSSLNGLKNKPTLGCIIRGLLLIPCRINSNTTSVHVLQTCNVCKGLQCYCWSESIPTGYYLHQ